MSFAPTSIRIVAMSSLPSLTLRMEVFNSIEVDIYVYRVNYLVDFLDTYV